MLKPNLKIKILNMTFFFLGPINRFLSSVIFQPLGKLSYNIYLIHMTLQMYRLGKSRTNYYSGDFEYVSNKAKNNFKSNKIKIK